MSRISLAQRLNYMVCDTACNLLLNNRKFSVKQILQPQPLPHTPPIFLWVTHGAALLWSSEQGKALLWAWGVSSTGELQHSCLPPSPSPLAWAGFTADTFHLREESLTSFFPSFENSKCSFIYNLLLAHTYRPVCSTLGQHFLPAVLCACWFQILHLLWRHLNPMIVEGFFCPLEVSLHIYICYYREIIYMLLYMSIYIHIYIHIYVYVINQPRKEEGFRILDSSTYLLSVLPLIQ